MQTTPEIEALAAEIDSVPLEPRLGLRRMHGGGWSQGGEWREALKKAGGHCTQVALTPTAWAAAQRMHPSRGYLTQSRMVSAAIEAFEPLDVEAREAIERLRTDWPLDSDSQAISLAVRWLVWHIEKSGLNTIQFG